MATHSQGKDTGLARYTYRLRVSSTASSRLLAEWDRCRWIWNECVDRSKKAYRDGEECGPAGLDRMLTLSRGRQEWLRTGSSVPQQQVIRDFGKARAKALKDVKNRLPMKQRAGMPKLKKKLSAKPTLNYTKRGFRLKGGRLALAGDITIAVVWSRELPVEPTSVRVYRDGLGDWYASFVVRVEPEPLPATGACVGVDWGVKDIATTTSDAHDLRHPEYGSKSAVKLSRYQRMMARRQPPQGQVGSRGYNAAKRQAAKAHKKVACQRRDTARKWAKQLVTDFDHIAAEDFKPKFLAKSTMARKAADAAIGAAKRELINMVREHRRILYLVNPAHTTMDCGRCNARTTHALPLSQRMYTCTVCGFVSPRDKNSARVILVRAGLNPAGADCARPGQPLVDQAA